MMDIIENFTTNALYFRMNKKLISALAFFPLVVIAETTKEKVEKGRALLIQKISSDATSVAQTIVDQKGPELQRVLEVQKSLCFDNRSCVEAIKGLSAVLKKLKTGVYAPEGEPLLPAIDEAIKNNSDTTTPEELIAEPLRQQHIETLVAAKEAVKSDQEFSKFFGMIVRNFMGESKNPSADLCNFLDEKSLQSMGKRVSERFQSVKSTHEGALGAWSDAPEQQREQLTREMIKLWVTHPGAYEVALEELGRKSHSVKKGILSSIEDMKEDPEVLAIIEDNLKLLGVDPRAIDQKADAKKKHDPREKWEEAKRKREGKSA
jgi:hypothetical protein